MGKFLQETIDDHRKNFDPSNIRDLLDTYLFEIQKANEEGNGHNLFEGRDHGKHPICLRLKGFCTGQVRLDTL